MFDKLSDISNVKDVSVPDRNVGAPRPQWQTSSSCSPERYTESCPADGRSFDGVSSRRTRAGDLIDGRTLSPFHNESYLGLFHAAHKSGTAVRL